jgi:hypothetical protein
MQSTEPQSTDRGTGRRGSAWFGIVAAVLYVAGVMLMLAPTPNDKHHKSPTKYAADYEKFFADGDKRTIVIIGVYVIILATIAFVVFGSHLRDRLAAAGATGAGRLTFAGAILFAALTMVGALAFAWIPASITFGNGPVPRGEINYLAPQLAFGFLLVGGMAGAALTLCVSGVAGARSKALPAWLGWAGLVVGIIVFAIGSWFMPVLLFVLWTIAASIVCLRRPYAVS